MIKRRGRNASNKENINFSNLPNPLKNRNAKVSAEKSRKHRKFLQEKLENAHNSTPSEPHSFSKLDGSQQGSNSSRADPFMKYISRYPMKQEKVDYPGNCFMDTPPVKKVKINEEFGLRVNSPEICEGGRFEQKYNEKMQRVGNSIFVLQDKLNLTSPKFSNYESPSK